jgi:mRNA interferase RelE/StbE
MNLQLTKRAEKNFASLSWEEQECIVVTLNKFQADQHNCDLKKLKGQTDTWRLRVGDFRVFLKPDKPNQTVYVTGIKRRGNAYR